MYVRKVYVICYQTNRTHINLNFQMLISSSSETQRVRKGSRNKKPKQHQKLGKFKATFYFYSWYEMVILWRRVGKREMTIDLACNHNFLPTVICAASRVTLYLLVSLLRTTDDNDDDDGGQRDEMSHLSCSPQAGRSQPMMDCWNWIPRIPTARSILLFYASLIFCND